MKKSDKLVSIIVPIYNGELYLLECINSILNQTYKNLEIILIDDGSTDNSGTICNQVSKLDKRVVVIHKENEGQGIARNLGNEISKGEFIVYVDSDDIIEKNMIEILMKVQYETNADITSTQIDEFIDKIPSLNSNDYKPIVMNKNEIRENFIKMDGYFFHVVPGKLIRKEIINNIYFPNIRAIEDEFFLTDLFLKTTSLAIVNAPLYHYRQTMYSTMRGGFNIERSYIVNALDDRKRKYQSRQIDSLLISIIQGQILYESAYWYKIIIENSSLEKQKIKEMRTLFLDNFKGGIRSKKISIKLKLLLILNYISPILYKKVVNIYERKII